MPAIGSSMTSNVGISQWYEGEGVSIMLRLLLSIALVTALMPARALAAVPAQSTSVTRGAVIKLKGTPHLDVLFLVHDRRPAAAVL